MQNIRFKRNYIPEIVSFLFIILFVYAGLTKLLDFQKFRLQLAQSPLLTSYAGLVAWLVPSVEFGISFLLAIPRYRLIGLYASFGMMVLFAAYIVAITRFSSSIPCSCGGVLEKMSWNQHLIFNLVFVALGLAAVLFQAKQQKFLLQ